METDQIYLLINKRLEGEITPEESQTLENWLESGSNRQKLTEMEKIWEHSGRMAVDLQVNGGQAWEQVHDRIKTDNDPSKRIWLKVAATLLLMISLGLGYFWLAPVTNITYHTAHDEQLQLILPDDSRVWLNENSTLSYTKGFDQGRTLRLSGEAFFEVTRDPNRPFTVNSSFIQTTVLGTSFNISENEEAGLAEVAVASGKVKVNLLNKPSQAVLLEAGTTASYVSANSELTKSSSQDLNVLAWKERKLVFKNHTLSDIEKTLEEYFEVDIELDNPQLGSCQFTSDFTDPTLEEIIEILELTLEVSFKQQDNKYVLYGSGCNK